MGANGPVSASTKIAAGILASRLFGIVRQRVVAQFLGTSVYGDIFTFATKFPNVLQNLLGDGVLSASFIPVYSELLEKDRREEAGRVAGAVFALLLAVAGIVAALGVVLAPLAVSVLLPTYAGADRALAITAVRVIFPTTGILVLSAWCIGIQNSHRRFLISYLAPIASSVAVIAALFAAGHGLLWRDGDLLLAAAWGTFAGAILQFAVQLPSVLHLEPMLRVRLDTAQEGLRETVRTAGPAIAGRGVVQVSSYLDLYLAGLLQAGAMASLGFAQTLYMLPISLFGMSIVAAELPELSRQRDQGSEVLRGRTNAALERMAFYVAPSAVAFLFLGSPLVGAFYQGGAFGPDSTDLVAWTLRAYALGLVATTSGRVASSAFYALRDTRTPARIALARVLVSAAVGFAAMAQFESVLGLPVGVLGDWRIGTLKLGAVGLAAGAAVGAWVEWLLLKRALAARIGPIGASWAVTARIAVANLAAAAAATAVGRLLPALHPIATATILCSAFGSTYLGLGAALGLPEAAVFARRLGGVYRRGRK